jgi:hypothetical protein
MSDSGDANQAAYPVPDSREELLQALKEAEAWEREQKDLWFWEKLGRLPFALLDRLTPKAIHRKIGQALDEIGGFIQHGGRYLVSERSILDKVKANWDGGPYEHSKTTELQMGDMQRVPLRVMDKTADRLTSSRSTIATAQGATTGFGGLFTLVADIPAILGLSLKIIQEMAICYGFDPKSEEERAFAVKVLQFASSDIVGKQAVLGELTVLENGQRHALSQLQGWREAMTVYWDNFGWKKLFQAIPVAGMLFGALINRGMLQDVADTAKMLYRKRRVLERLNAATEHQEGNVQHGNGDAATT